MAPSTVVATVYVLALVLIILDTTIVSVALKSLGDEFDVSVSSIQWVVTGYLVSLAVWMPASGWFGDRFGTKRTFLVALGIFTVASSLCGLARSLPELVAFRALQGVGGGLLTPVGLTMLWRAYPPERRAAASRALMIPLAFAPAIGPTLGGLLIDTASWRWVFLVNVPVGGAALVFGARRLREHREPSAQGFDVAGFVLASLALGSALFALSEGPDHGWTTARVVVSAIVAAVATALLIAVELRSPAPMLNLRLFGNRLFRITNVVSMFASGTFIGVLFMVPLMVQTVGGESALDSGLVSAPHALGVLGASQLAARAYPRVGPSRLMTAGLLGMAAVLLVMSRINATTPDAWLYLEMFLLGALYALPIISLQTSSFASISSEDTGRASALYNTQRQVGSALGVAVLTTTLTTFLPDDGETAAGHEAFQKVYIVAAALAATGAFIARLVPDKEAMSAFRHPEALHEAPNTA